VQPRLSSRLRASLLAAPATVPALAALALFVVWATDKAGYPVTHWGPGGLILLVLLAITVAFVGVRAAWVPGPVRVALGCLAAYTVLSFLSIAWAAVPGDAFEGADRTLLYLLVFALFACWPQTGRTAALLVGVWIAAMSVLALVVLLHLTAVGGAELERLVPGGRLAYPSEYPNATAAQWLMPAWAALLLARAETLPWALRGLLGAGACLLAETALLSQSRGSLYATAAMLVIVFAFVPGRLRTFAVMVPVTAAFAAAAPSVLDVGDHLHAGQTVPHTLETAVRISLVAALAAGLAVAALAALDTRLASAPARHTMRSAVAVAAVLALVAIVAGGLAAAGDPVARVRHAWHTFKGGYGSNSSTGSRLVSGLGSNRYDFYRVALDEFVAHPVVGIGVDNFQQPYLVHGRSDETPRYPHSAEVRVVSQTGIVGVLLAVAGLGAALLAAWRAMRAADRMRGYAAAAALAAFAYWLVHGSFDWFWEFAGLGAPAFAMLGLACALSAPVVATPPSASTAPGTGVDSPAGRPRRRWATVALALAGVALAAVAFAAPTLSQLEVESAARVWTRSPTTAYGRLDTAASLDPFSDQPYLVAGSIAGRLGDLARADHEFALALGRTPDGVYATLERGAIASERGERARARALLARAVRLAPREPLARRALQVVEGGGRLSLRELNRAILTEGKPLA
jgi:hypothetical protein